MTSNGIADLCEGRRRAGEKITHKTVETEKSPTRQSKKSPTRRAKKLPSYYNQWGVCPVDDTVLRQMLRRNGQDEWITTVRVEGLQLLLGNCLRRDNKKGFCISTSLAEQYISEIKRPTSAKTIPEPRGLLCEIGLLVRTHPSVCSWHVKQSARFRMHADFAGERHPFPLSKRQQRKLAKSEVRRESRLNQRYPACRGILAALNKLSLASRARQKIVRLMRSPSAAATQRVVEAIDSGEHTLCFDKVGQVTTTISSLPRELKLDLLLEGEEALFADLSHAHHCFLPRLVDDRIDHHRESALWVTCFTPGGSPSIGRRHWFANWMTRVVSQAALSPKSRAVHFRCGPCERPKLYRLLTSIGGAIWLAASWSDTFWTWAACAIPCKIVRRASWSGMA